MQAIHRWAFHHAEAQWLWFVWAVNVGVKKILAASGAFAEEAKVVNQIEQLSTGVWSFGDDEADSIDEFLKIASPAFKAASQQPGFEPNLEWRWRALREIGAVPPRFGDVLGPGTPVLEPEEAGFGSVKRKSLRQQRKGGGWVWHKKKKVWLKGWRPPRVDGQRAGEDDEELRYKDAYPFAVGCATHTVTDAATGEKIQMATAVRLALAAQCRAACPQAWCAVVCLARLWLGMRRALAGDTSRLV